MLLSIDSRQIPLSASHYFLFQKTSLRVRIVPACEVGRREAYTILVRNEVIKHTRAEPLQTRLSLRSTMWTTG
jgi:hypothetical protein